MTSKKNADNDVTMHDVTSETGARIAIIIACIDCYLSVGSVIVVCSSDRDDDSVDWEVFTHGDIINWTVEHWRIIVSILDDTNTNTTFISKS